MVFFYNSLMTPKALQKVLSLPRQPNMISATVKAFRIITWKGETVLLFSTEGNVARGVACEIQTKEMYDSLKTYEGRNWRDFKCEITLEGQDGKKVSGICFK